MEYNFREIEKKWQKRWVEEKTYQVKEDETKQKYYVLNMFPYPSGAGLHVGHPLGYIASDIYARYKRLQGFNVLNPMGYDAYGLPAEQYAIQTGQHPAITTINNIDRYREQLDKIGFCFDWSREIRTCEPEYYHWIATIIIIPPIVGTPTFFTLKGSIDASRWVSVICLRLSRLMKYSPKIAEINNDKMIAINERNET